MYICDFDNGIISVSYDFHTHTLYCRGAEVLHTISACVQRQTLVSCYLATMGDRIPLQSHVVEFLGSRQFLGDDTLDKCDLIVVRLHQL